MINTRRMKLIYDLLKPINNTVEIVSDKIFTLNQIEFQFLAMTPIQYQHYYSGLNYFVFQNKTKEKFIYFKADDDFGKLELTQMDKDLFIAETENIEDSISGQILPLKGPSEVPDIQKTAAYQKGLTLFEKEIILKLFRKGISPERISDTLELDLDKVLAILEI